MSQNPKKVLEELLINAFIVAVKADVGVTKDAKDFAGEISGRLETIRRLKRPELLEKLSSALQEELEGKPNKLLESQILAALALVQQAKGQKDIYLAMTEVLEEIKRDENLDKSTGTGLASAIQESAEYKHTKKDSSGSTDASSLQENFHLGQSMDEVRAGGDRKGKLKSGFNLPLPSFLSFRKTKQPSLREIGKGEPDGTFSISMKDVIEGKVGNTTTAAPTQTSDGRKLR